MSYQVLARKYRPKSFDTLVGQEHVVRALTHALEQKRLHHAYLFTGTRGVGKTTLSRILAKSFNCETGITANPCGVCDACTAIDAGRFVDYIEMDAASNRGVDEMAQLLEQAVYAPSNARFKVYMIDEVHMLTNHAFNSMLKTLEEPPEHVKFILATTDPQKIPVTVLSRCLQFNLKQMPPGHIIGHLDNILGQEQIPFEAPALRLLAQGAHGSMRDALSLTDQAIAYAAGKVTLEAVQGMLGALDQSFLIRLLDALAARDGAGLLAVADEMAARSLSYNAALQDLGSLLHRIALAQSVPAALAEDTPEREAILRLAKTFDAEEVQLFYQIAVHGRNELGLAPDEYAGFSMTLLRMLAFRPEMGGTEGKAAVASAPAPAPRSAPLAVTPAARIAAPASAPVSTAAPKSASAAPVRGEAAAASLASPLATTAAAEVPAVAAPANSAPPAASPARAAPAAVNTAGMSPAMAALAAARGGLRRGPGAPAQAAPAPAPAATASSTAAVISAPPPAPDAAFDAAPAAASPVPAARPAVEAARPAVQERPPAASRPPVMDDIDMPPAPPWEMDDHPPIELEVRQDRGIYNAPAQKKTELRPDAAPRTVSLPVREAAPAKADLKYEAPPPVPVPQLAWDGNWPALAAILPVRGVAQQLAQQSELLRCEADAKGAQLHLRVAMETLLSSGSVEKLSTALNEHFAGKAIRVSTEIGAVRHTANAQATADRAERQREAEETIRKDPFVQTLMREFGAAIVPGSVRPV